MARISYEVEEASNGSGLGSWVVGLAIGAIGGVTVALLTAPKPGKELRGEIKEQAKTVPAKVSNLLDDTLDLYASGLNYCQLILEEQTMRVKRAVAAGKLAAAKKREELEMGPAQSLPFQHR